MSKFTISFPECTINVDDVWPDGDAPHNPTPFDVLCEMREYSDLHTVIQDWNLLDKLFVNGEQF